MGFARAPSAGSAIPRAVRIRACATRVRKVALAMPGMTSSPQLVVDLGVACWLAASHAAWSTSFRPTRSPGESHTGACGAAGLRCLASARDAMLTLLPLLRARRCVTSACSRSPAMPGMNLPRWLAATGGLASWRPALSVARTALSPCIKSESGLPATAAPAGG